MAEYITHEECRESHARLESDIKDIKHLLYGNGSDGLKTEVALNKDFRRKMEVQIESATKKIVSMFVVNMLMIIGFFVYLVAFAH